MTRARNLTLKSLQYLQQANDSLVTIVQIETKEALENVRNTLAFGYVALMASI